MRQGSSCVFFCGGGKSIQKYIYWGSINNERALFGVGWGRKTFGKAPTCLGDMFFIRGSICEKIQNKSGGVRAWRLTCWRLGNVDVPYYKNAQRPDLLEAGTCDVPYYQSAHRPVLLEAGAC